MNDTVKLRELQKEMYKLNVAYSKLEDLYSSTLDRNTKLLEQVEDLISQNQKLYKELHALKNPGNIRGAGRKKGDQKWTDSYVTFCRLYQSSMDMNELMDEMQISRATYYRYKKVYDAKGIMAANE